MPIEINFELSDQDLTHFKSMMQAVIENNEHLDDEVIIAKARELITDMKQAKLPEFVSSRVSALSTLIDALQDNEWQLPEDEKKEIMLSLAYFSEPEDVVPDNIPGLGYIDDAIMIELVIQDMSLDLKAYREFCSFRTTEELRRGKDANVDRESWLASTRAQIRSSMRKKRASSKKQFFSRIM